jgi:hypothetical protein
MIPEEYKESLKALEKAADAIDNAKYNLKRRVLRCHCKPYLLRLLLLPDSPAIFVLTFFTHFMKSSPTKLKNRMTTTVLSGEKLTN